MATDGQAANLASMEGRRVVRMPIADPVYGLSRLLPMTQARDVLLVQEDADLRGVWASALHGAGFVPHPLDNVEAMCEALLDIRHWRAIVVDLGFRGLEATKFLDRLRVDMDAIPTLLTGWDVSILYSESARAFPRLAFRPAPLQPRDLLAAVRALPPPPPAKHLQPSSGMFVVHKPERMLRPAREKGSVLPEAVAARADGEKAAAETRAPGRDAWLEHEMGRAREIQRRLLPETLPQPAGFEIAARYLPAEDVGGDYYDVITLPDGRIAVLVADVSGKGVSAAMVMVMARTVFHSVSPWVADARQLVLQAADRIARDLPCGMFISLACGLLDPATGAISIVNAGHLPPLLWSIENDSPFVSTLDVAGGAIGLVKSPHFQRTLLDCTVELRPGEQLVFFTDGVNEAMNVKNEEFGDKRLHNSAKSNGRATAEELAQGIVNSVLCHRGEAPASDDITVLVVKRKER